MKWRRLAVFGAVAWLSATPAQAASPEHPRLSRKQDLFFIENDFVYSRFLQLSRDGSYHRIDRDRTTAAEVDRGTWEQEADGTLLLHFTREVWRFRALLAGPLSIRLDDAPDLPGLARLAAAVRALLARSGDTAFASDTAQELSSAAIALKVDPRAESFRRSDLETIVGQIDDFVWSEQHGTYRFSPVKRVGLPILLIQQGAVFADGDIARVQGEYRVLQGQAPPFYFAQVAASKFAREAGSWQKLP